MEIFIFWFIFAVIVAVWAGNWGRSGFGFFILSVILSPILSAFILLLKGKIDGGVGKMKCPDCAEYIQEEAIVCRYCGCRFEEIEEENIESFDEESIRKIKEYSGTVPKKQEANWKHYLFIAVFTGVVISITMYFISDNRKVSGRYPKRTIAIQNVTPPVSDCVEFVSLVPAAEVAKEVGKSEYWVLGNYPINLWEKPSSAGYRGKKVGEMISGSNARLIEKRGGDYLVISQKDKSKGWVSNIQVKRVIKLNPKTFERCK